MKKQAHLVLVVLSVFLLHLRCTKDSTEEYILSVGVDPVEGGSVNPSLGKFESGTKLTISAIPAAGYDFEKWTGAMSGTSNPLEFTITMDTEITAVFVREDMDGDGVGDDMDRCLDTPKSESVDEYGCSDSQKDTDGDGVPNSIDECSETPEGESVDELGCSDSQKDVDEDGVPDNIDQCPGTPPDEEVNQEGCSSSQNDSDGDGVSDSMDQCPDTPSQENVDENGCSASQKDTDGDGVTDDVDQCVDTSSGETVDQYGCSESETDGDGDGISNDIDQCPNTPSNESVDGEGCSASQTDSDGDGITDNIDECPGTVDGDDVNPQGCSASQRDSDEDGVNDSEDRCANTPSGEAVDSQGCTDSQKDTDGDGVTDDIDICPSTPSGQEVDGFGCAESQIDSDQDGVYDSMDECVNTPDGELVDVQGCSDSQKDTDGDGVSDSMDQCPGTPSGENVDANGCSDNQLDTSPPAITSVAVTEVTPTSFTVDWNVDEESKGYIRFGTVSGIYIASTSLENDFLTRHVQTVGGGNPFTLNPETTYYWQIYVEDENGNAGFSEERETTTPPEDSDGDGINDDLDLCPNTEPGRTVDNEGCPLTYIPDDGFEALLINLGFDDVLDDYVKTNNITGIASLEFSGGSIGPFASIDLTGIEDFESLAALEFITGFDDDYIQVSSFEKVNISQLEDLILSGVELQEPLLINNTSLTLLSLRVKANYIEIRNNPGLTFAGGRLNAISVLISDNPNITNVGFVDCSLETASIVNNESLQIIDSAGDFNIVTQVLISNNTNLQQIISDLAPMQTSLIEIENSPNITRILWPNIDGAGFGFIDLSGLPNLEVLELNDQALTSIDVSNNSQLTNLNVTRNPLTCIQVNQTQLNDIPSGWNIDPEDSYSLDCSN